MDCLSLLSVYRPLPAPALLRPIPSSSCACSSSDTMASIHHLPLKHRRKSQDADDRSPLPVYPHTVRPDRRQAATAAAVSPWPPSPSLPPSSPPTTSPPVRAYTHTRSFSHSYSSPTKSTAAFYAPTTHLPGRPSADASADTRAARRALRRLSSPDAPRARVRLPAFRDAFPDAEDDEDGALPAPWPRRGGSTSAGTAYTHGYPPAYAYAYEDVCYAPSDASDAPVPADSEPDAWPADDDVVCEDDDEDDLFAAVPAQTLTPARRYSVSDERGRPYAARCAQSSPARPAIAHAHLTPTKNKPMKTAARRGSPVAAVRAAFSAMTALPRQGGPGPASRSSSEGACPSLSPGASSALASPTSAVASPDAGAAVSVENMLPDVVRPMADSATPADALPVVAPIPVVAPQPQIFSEARLALPTVGGDADMEDAPLMLAISLTPVTMLAPLAENTVLKTPDLPHSVGLLLRQTPSR
jgi:hypothetical protein